MPQMSPMLWLMLFNFSILSLLMTMIILYFYWYPFKLTSTKKNFSTKNYSLKW